MATPGEITLSIGQRNLSFVCYGEGYPMPTVVWKKDGNAGVFTTTTMNVSSTNSSNRLEIRPAGVTYQEAGNYTCEVYNGVDGKSKVSDKLEVICEYFSLLFIWVYCKYSGKVEFHFIHCMRFVSLENKVCNNATRVVRLRVTPLVLSR